MRPDLPALASPRLLAGLRLLALALVLGLTGMGSLRAWQTAAQVAPLRAADALPVYLASAAVRDGEDPTQQSGLQAAYDRRGMTVRAATFSNLYPASAGVLLQPLAAGSWEAFVPLWRGLLLLGALMAGAGGGFSAVRGKNAPLAAALGAWIAVVAFPVTIECMSLGQANLLVGGLLGLSMAALSRGRPGLAGGAAVLGAGLKLVPGIVVWTLLAGRRWKGLAVTAVAGLALTALTVAYVPLDRVVSGVLGTLRFQGAIAPGWLDLPETPVWLRAVGDFRHNPAMLVTLAFMGLVAFGVAGEARGAEGQRRWMALAGTVALATAWLGADAAGFHVLYAPLTLPAVCWVALWPLDEEAPAWSLPFALVGALPALVLLVGLPGVPDEAALVLAGLVTWAAVALRLLVSTPPLPVPGWALVGVALGFGVAHVEHLSGGPRGPDPAAIEGGNVAGLGLPEGVGHGGPQPGGGTLDGAARPPGTLDPEVTAALPRSAPVAGSGSSGVLMEVLLQPDAASKLTSHLVQSPRRWAKVDDPLAAWLASAAPVPPAALVPYGPLVRWLAWEQVALDSLPDTGPQRAQWNRTWAALGDH